MNGKLNNINESCGFEADIAAFVYGEATAAEKTRLGGHMLKCESCAADIEALTAARLAVSEWRASEFDLLATPRFEIETDGSKVASWRLVDWFAGLLRPAALVPLAFLIAAAIGFALYVRNSPVDSEIAVISQPVTVDQLPAASLAVPPSDDATVGSPARSEPKAAAYTSKRASASPKQAYRRPVSVPAPQNVAAQASPRRIRQEPSSAAVASAATALTDFNDPSELEDESLRLADLLAEVDPG